MVKTIFFTCPNKFIFINKKGIIMYINVSRTCLNVNLVNINTTNWIVLIVKLFLRLHSLCVLPSVTFWKKIMMMIPVTWIQNEYLHSTKIGYWCRRQLKNQWELPNCRWKSMEIKVDIIKMGHFVCPICNSNSKQISISILRKLHRLDEWWFF